MEGFSHSSCWPRALLGAAVLALGGCGGGMREAPDLPSQTLIDPVNDEERNRIASAGESSSLEAGESFEQAGHRRDGATPAAPAIAPTRGAGAQTPQTAGPGVVEVERSPIPVSGPREVGRAKGTLTTVIESGEPDSPPPTLLEASAAAKQKRQSDPEHATFVVTDSNLSTFKNVPLTTAAPTNSSDESAAAGAGDGPDSESDETYWRDRVGDLRREWKDKVERRDGLRKDILRHREAFYAADDPYYRDSELKPLWDRALEEFDDVTRQIGQVREDLREALIDGRRKGVQPGWLREASDLEPDDSLRDLENDPALDIGIRNGADPSEPTIWEGPDGP